MRAKKCANIVCSILADQPTIEKKKLRKRMFAGKGVYKVDLGYPSGKGYFRLITSLTAVSISSAVRPHFCRSCSGVPDFV